MNVLGFCGSLRTESWNRRLLAAFGELLPAGNSFQILEIGDLPLYNQDLEAQFPTEAQALKDNIKAADGVLIATPEFNRTVPAALKNMLEWTSRPYGDNAWVGKKVLVMGGSSGNVSSALAQYNVKQILLYLDAVVLGQPEVMIAKMQETFETQGALEPKTKEFFQKAAGSFIDFLSK